LSEGDPVGSAFALRGSRRAIVSARIEYAALTLFLKRHPDEVTTDEIAQVAGISRRTFFRYFESRNDVLTATPTRSLMRTLRAICDRPLEETLVEALLATARSRTVVGEEKELVRLSGEVMMRYPEVWGRALGHLRKTTDTLFAEAIAYRLRSTGRDDLHSDVIGTATAAIVVHVYIQWIHQGCLGDLEERLREAFAAVGEAFDVAAERREG
jgi:AcrR family transcriptional regulator